MTTKKNKNDCSIYLALGALGVVFGDIGTSPLYAVRETLKQLVLTENNVLGVLSLIFWSLIIIISIKYLLLVFRADNDGEGGVLALFALLKQKKTKYEPIFYVLAIFGTGLVIGDGMITPAISVTSAIEGLEILSPQFSHLVLPLSCGILIALFMLQYNGSAKIGAAFGPIVLFWFIVIGILGLVQIINNPLVLRAVNPYYAWNFLYEDGYRGYLLLGGVFLVVTGGEALYADIGHFGVVPIRYSWFMVVLPGLLLNYFGQGAYLLQHPAAIINPFYLLVPKWGFLPLVVLATIVTIIASQAVISATYSLTRQAVLLGLYPHLPIIPTSDEYAGQVYIPQVNFFLMIGTLILILTFQNSSNMANAYGIAVNLNMLSVSIMVTYAARQIWHWSVLRTACVFGGFILIDLTFLGANMHKFLTGGWVPTVFALFVAVVMFSWNRGMQFLQKNFYMKKEDVTKIIKQLRNEPLNHLPGVTGIFVTDIYDHSGGSFLHFLKLNRAVPENILIVSYKVENKPYLSTNERFMAHQLDQDIWQLTLHYGFMDTIAIPETLRLANAKKIFPFIINVDEATYLVEIPNVVATRTKKTLRFYWQEKLFAYLMRNYSANLNIEFYHLPYNRTIAIGTYCFI